MDPWLPLGPSGHHVLTRYSPALRRRTGRVQWAGTETATYRPGYMDGAVRSGETAAAEALAALRRRRGRPPAG